MIKEFVPYEEALALKKLGFDEPCLFAFDNCSTPMRCSDLRTNEQKFNGVNYNSSTYTSQPTFSQAFRWFREKHNLHCEIGCAKNQFFFRIGKVDSFPHILDDNNRRYYNSCEEAELAALIRLIKVITNE